MLGLAVASHSQPQTHEVPTRAFPPMPDEPAPQPSPPAPPPEQRLGAPPPARAHWAPPPQAWPAPGPDAGATADDKPDRWEDRPTLLEGHFGFGTPYGVLGIAAEQALARYFALVGGGGLGGAGPQVAGGVRARVPIAWIAFALELTWSGGPYDHEKCRIYCFDQDESYEHWDFAHWLNVAPAVEFRSQGGFSARVYAGLATILNPASAQCVGRDEQPDCYGDEQLPFAGVAFGGAF